MSIGEEQQVKMVKRMGFQNLVVYFIGLMNEVNYNVYKILVYWLVCIRFLYYVIRNIFKLEFEFEDRIYS